MKLQLIIFILLCTNLVYSQNNPYTIKVLTLYASNANEPSLATSKSEVEEKERIFIIEANEALENSHVNFRLESLGVEFADLGSKNSENNNSPIDLFTNQVVNNEDLSNYDKWNKEKYLPYFNLRKEKEADVVIFVDRKYNTESTIDSKKHTNAANIYGGILNAWIKVNFKEFNTSITLHEIGHVFGLTHEMGATFPYDMDRPGNRTIMAINCAQADEINYKKPLKLYSGSESKYQSQPYYSECNWDAVSILNKNAEEYSLWGEKLKAGTAVAKFSKAPSKIIDISIVNDCVSWARDENNKLWRWDGFDWKKINTDRSFSQLAAKNYDVIYLIENDTLFTFDDYTGNWGFIPTKDFTVSKIATNSKGNIWVLDASGNLYERTNQEWTQRSRDKIILDLTVKEDNSPLVIVKEENGQLNSQIYFRHENGEGFMPYRKNIIKIDIGIDGTIVMIDHNNKILVIEGDSQIHEVKNNVPAMCNCADEENPTVQKKCNSQIIVGKANDISVYDKNRIWALSSDYTYKYVGNNGFQIVQQYGKQ